MLSNRVRKKAWILAAIFLGSTLIISAVSFALYNKLAWQADHEDLTLPIKDIFQTDIDLEGDWVTYEPMQGSDLTIQKKKLDKYSIRFSTGGCLDDWSSKRKGMYSNGILRLNRPVTEYPGCNKYDTLYTVKVDGFHYLISQEGIRFLVEEYSKDGVVEWSKHMPGQAFHRKDQQNELLQSVYEERFQSLIPEESVE